LTKMYRSEAMNNGKWKVVQPFSLLFSCNFPINFFLHFQFSIFNF